MASEGKCVVLVTGGFGLVGMAIQQVLEVDQVFDDSIFVVNVLRKAALPTEEWVFVSSKDCDLRSFASN